MNERKQTYVIDGKNFSTLAEFYVEISRILIPGAKWGHNLDAFDDILSGGFGTPEGGFVLVWKNARLSKERLGYPATIRRIEQQLASNNPYNHDYFVAELERAKQGQGPTLFDKLMEIIKRHSRGGAEAEDGVELVLE
jgi:RNAse (barnase) inhibitor barstar